MKIAILILLSIIAIYCFGCVSNIRQPHSDYPVISHISWPSYRDSLEITNLEIQIIDSSTNLSDQAVLARFWITGKIHGDSRWHYAIDKVQISERFVASYPDSQELIPDILIEPFLICYNDRKKINGSYDFRIKEEYYLHNYMWHKNKYRIRCGNIERILLLDQDK